MLREECYLGVCMFCIHFCSSVLDPCIDCCIKADAYYSTCCIMPNFMVLLSILLDLLLVVRLATSILSPTGSQSSNGMRMCVCVCVCVGGINLKCALRWHVHV